MTHEIKTLYLRISEGGDILRSEEARLTIENTTVALNYLQRCGAKFSAAHYLSDGFYLIRNNGGFTACYLDALPECSRKAIYRALAPLAFMQCDIPKKVSVHLSRVWHDRRLAA